MERFFGVPMSESLFVSAVRLCLAPVRPFCIDPVSRRDPFRAKISQILIG